jgi:hypothetical protein
MDPPPPPSNSGEPARADTPASPPPPPPPPPRAFTQGVGTVFQFVGVGLFLVMMFVCCGSGLLSKNVAERQDLTEIGWHVRLGADTDLFYSAQRAIICSVFGGVFFGIALAGLGLGLQAQHRAAPVGAVAVTAFATIFWLIQAAFAVQTLHSAWMAVVACTLGVLFGSLLALAAGAWREMRRDPPPAGHEVLPPGFKVPYSHLHPDPPEVRLANELEERRRRLDMQRKELEALEERIRRRRESPP